MVEDIKVLSRYSLKEGIPMTVTGIVLTLTQQALLEQALIGLKKETMISLIEPVGCKIALVCESSQVGEDRALFERLERLAWVAHVEIAYADFGSMS